MLRSVHLKWTRPVLKIIAINHKLLRLKLIKPSQKYILIDAPISSLRIPMAQRWRDLQAHQKEMNQLNRPCFVQWDQPNKYQESSDRSRYSNQHTCSYSLLDSSGTSECFSAAGAGKCTVSEVVMAAAKVETIRTAKFIALLVVMGFCHHDHHYNRTRERETERRCV